LSKTRYSVLRDVLPAYRSGTDKLVVLIDKSVISADKSMSNRAILKNSLNLDLAGFLLIYTDESQLICNQS
jgi:hypothetical protein